MTGFQDKHTGEGISGKFVKPGFLPSSSFWATPLLIVLQALVFVFMLVSGTDLQSPSPEDLLSLGGNFRSSVIGGEYWRLFTSVFLHAGIYHLLINSLTLIMIGSVLEPVTGSIRLLIFWILCGLAGSLNSMLWHDASVAVGASGALFGLAGMMCAMLLSRPSIFTGMGFYIVVSLVFAMMQLLFGFFSVSVDNAAHLGGFGCGLVCGIPVAVKQERSLSRNWLIPASVTLFLCLSAIVLVNKLENPVGDFEKAYASFLKLEKQALQIFKLEDALTGEKLAQAFYEGTSYWKEAKKGMEGLKQETLPAGLQESSKNIILYCELRRQQFELIYMYYNTLDIQFYNAAKELSDDIEGLLNVLHGQLGGVVK